MPRDTGHGTDSTPRDDTETARSGRRDLLAAGGGVAAALLAGCSGVLPGGDDEPNGNQTDGNSTGTATPEGPTSETDVTGLQYKTDGSTRTFYVTLAPSDAGADWWQVETLGGEKLARKAFDQPRTGDRFTSTKQLELGEETTAVVVRGHSAETGYGGQVMLADLEEGFIALEKQGNDAASFENYSF